MNFQFDALVSGNRQVRKIWNIDPIPPIDPSDKKLKEKLFDLSILSPVQACIIRF